MKNKYRIALPVIIAAIFLTAFSGCKKADVLNIDLQSVEAISIVAGNTGDEVKLSKDSNAELFNYIINHFENTKYIKYKNYDDYGGYSYVLWFTGETENSITILTSGIIDFDRNIYSSDKSIDIKQIEEIFNH